MGSSASTTPKATRVEPFTPPPDNTAKPLRDSQDLDAVLPTEPPKVLEVVEEYGREESLSLCAKQRSFDDFNRDRVLDFGTGRRSPEVCSQISPESESSMYGRSVSHPRSSSSRERGREGRETTVTTLNSLHADRPSGRVSRRAMASRCRMQQQIRETLANERRAREEVDRQELTWWPSTRCIVENTVFIALTTVLTIYALIGDDLRLMFTNASADPVFDVMTGVCILIFITEIILSCLGKKDYFGSFFFFLDAISTVTLVLDITVVSEWLLDPGEDGNLRSSRTARLGARATRVVRVIRLVRILKLYKAVLQARQRATTPPKPPEERLLDDDWDDEEDDEPPIPEALMYESQVGKKLADLTTRRCVIIILSMMMGSGFLEVTEDLKYPTAQAFGVERVWEMFQAMEQNSALRDIYEETFLEYVYFFNWYGPQLNQDLLFWFGVVGKDWELLRNKAGVAQLSEEAVQAFDRAYVSGDLLRDYGSMPPSMQSRLWSSWDVRCEVHDKDHSLRLGLSLISEGVDYPVQCPEGLRDSERTVAKAGTDVFKFAFYFDRRKVTQEEAQYNFFTTCFLCAVLCAASLMFSADANALVVNPIENMMLKVDMIRINPFIAATMTDDAFKKEAIEKARAAKLQKDVWRARSKKAFRILTCTSSAETQKRPLETAILEKTIIKLGTLLAIGFGTAGMDIISQNLAGQESAALNAMIPGSIVKCIIGHARIMNFGTFTEVLQSRVLRFVNQVAEVIHGVVDAYNGAPSVNNGDAFLYVWKVDDTIDAGDLAAMATAYMLVGIHRSAKLAAYRSHPALQQRLGSNPRVDATFGLHAGWAIEGALGSEYKIDASYVSPNVSIAEAAQRSASTYRTNIIVTEATHGALSPGMATICRLIDRVKLKGSPEPMNLYTVDLYYKILDVEAPLPNLKWTTRQRYRARQALEIAKADRLKRSARLAVLFDTDEDLSMMRRPYSMKFQKTFGMGYENYSQGEWKTAKILLNSAREVLGFHDGPTAAILDYMSHTNFRAPTWWKGVRPFEDRGARAPSVATEQQEEVGDTWRSMESPPAFGTLMGATTPDGSPGKDSGKPESVIALGERMKRESLGVSLTTDDLTGFSMQDPLQFQDSRQSKFSTQSELRPMTPSIADLPLSVEDLEE